MRRPSAPELRQMRQYLCVCADKCASICTFVTINASVFVLLYRVGDLNLERRDVIVAAVLEKTCLKIWEFSSGSFDIVKRIHIKKNISQIAVAELIVKATAVELTVPQVPITSTV